MSREETDLKSGQESENYLRKLSFQEADQTILDIEEELGPLHDEPLRDLLREEFAARYRQHADCYKSLRNQRDALQNKLDKADEDLRSLVEAIKANHQWHKDYDDTGTYEGSRLEEINLKALKEYTDDDT